MRQNNVKPMVEGGVLSAVAIVFALISAYMPVIGPFVNMIWPVPIILLGVRHGYKWSIMATVVSGLLIAMLMHPLHSVAIVVGFGLIGIVLGHAIRSKFSPGQTLIWGAAASLLSKAAVLSISAVVLGINPFEIQVDTLNKAITEAVNMYKGMGVNEETLAQITTSMQTSVELMKIIIPSGFVLASVADTLLNFSLARAVLGKLGNKITGFPPFKLWNLPRALGYLFIVSLVMIYWGQSRDIAILRNLSLNLIYITGVPLLVQGLALFYYLADKYRLSRFMWGIILVLIFMNGSFMIGTVFVGGIDIFVDYRRLKEQKE